MRKRGYRCRQEAMTRAVESGLRFLDGIIGAEGAWPAVGVFERGHPALPEWTPFAAASGILALEACDVRRAAALRARTRAFLYSHIEYPGVWRYYPRLAPDLQLAPDLDDTSLCSIAAGSHLWILMGRNVGPILSCRDDEGRFRTWIVPGDACLKQNHATKPAGMALGDGPESAPNMAASAANANVLAYIGGGSASASNLVDSVVNANVLAYIGDRPETRAAQEWLTELVEEGREPGTMPYYLSTMDLHSAMARANHLAPPVFARLRATLAARIAEQLESGGETIDAYRMAQGVTALAQLQATREGETVRRALECLLETQHANGGWPECLIWKGPPGTEGRFSSEALTTACCIGAIVRAMQA